MLNEEYAVLCRGLTKKFGSKVAVDSLDLQIEPGTLFSLLGVNGAGKTTTIRMLSSLILPSGGYAMIHGHDCVKEPDAVKRLVGVSPQTTAVSPRMTVFENLVFMEELYGADKKTAERNANEAAERYGMTEYLHSPSKILSGGQSRMLSVAMAMADGPKVLFLDEPTLGIDVIARRRLWKVINDLKGKVTIILTTHYMEEAEELSDRIGIMIDGRLRACGTMAELEAQTGLKGLEPVFINISEGSL